MTAVLDHTIVRARDRAVSAHYLAELLELQVGPATGPFLPVRTGNGVTLDYLDIDPTSPLAPQHYAFAVPDDLFDRALTRLHRTGQDYWADPFHTQPGQINTANRGRGLYVLEPAGHNLELQTVPDGTFQQR